MKRKAIIVDVDNTLIDIRHLEALYIPNNPQESDYIQLEKVYNQGIVINQTIDIVNKFIKDDYTILIVTARRDKPQIRRDLKLFIQNNFKNAKSDQIKLFLAPICQEPDYVIKEKIFNKHIKDNYDVYLALDDRDIILSLWSSYGVMGFKVCLISGDI